MEVAAEKASDYRIIRDWLNLNRPLRSTADLKWPNTSNLQMAHNWDDRGHLQFQDALSCALKTPVLSFPALKKSTVDRESGAKDFIRAVYSLELFFVKKCDIGKEHRLSSVNKWVLLPGNTTVFLSPAGCCKSRFANSSGLNAAQNSVREIGSSIVWRCVFCLPNYFPSLEPTETQFSFFKRKAQPAFATTGCDAAKCRRPPLPPCSRLWTKNCTAPLEVSRGRHSQRLFSNWQNILRFVILNLQRSMDICLEPNSLLLPQFFVTMVLLGATGTAMKN